MSRILFSRFHLTALETYRVVTSLISCVYPKDGVTSSTFNFSTGKNVSVETFWAGVPSYLSRFPAHANAGTYAYFWVMPTGPGAFTFLMNPFFAVNHTVDEFNALVKPWYDDLHKLGIPFQPNTTYGPIPPLILILRSKWMTSQKPLASGVLSARLRCLYVRVG